MKRLITSLTFAVALLGSSLAVSSTPALAINVFDQCAASASSAVCKAQGTDDISSMIKIVINTLLYLLGSIAVVMIIIGGIRYAVSNGDASSIQAAKNTIMYAVIGLVVAILSYAIVNFVVDAFK